MMKMYTNSEQTAKLIELGFDEPKSIEAYRDGHYVPFVEQQLVYSIGELLSFLPEEINNDTLPDMLGVYIDHNKMWTVDYSNVLGELYSTYRTELVDALYDMIVKLKEEGVI